MKHTVTVIEIEEIVTKHTIDIEVPDGRDLQEFLDEKVMEFDYIGKVLDKSGSRGSIKSEEVVHREVWDSEGTLLLEG